jgi:hypothetical protein
VKTGGHFCFRELKVVMVRGLGCNLKCRTPLQTFEETLSLAKEKQLDDIPPAA